MNKKLLVIIFVLAVAILASPISSAFATKPVLINAVLQMTGPPVYDIEIEAGGNQILRGTAPFVWGLIFTPLPSSVGDIRGPAVCDFVWTSHTGYYDGYTGTSVHTIDPATVIIDGLPLTGSLTILITISKGMQGTWRIIKGTDDLENLHGIGIWEENLATTNNPYDYIYTGSVHLDP